MTIDATRRQILRGSLGGAAGLLGGAMLPATLVSGATFRIRRDIDSLAIDDPMILTYATAVRYLRSLPTSDQRNWDRLSKIHSNLCPHQNWYLLPWHREYLLALERIIRRLPPGAVPGAANFIMPYWDWARNPRLPAAVSRPTSARRHGEPTIRAHPRTQCDEHDPGGARGHRRHAAGLRADGLRILRQRPAIRAGEHADLVAVGGEHPRPARSDTA